MNNCRLIRVLCSHIVSAQYKINARHVTCTFGLMVINAIRLITIFLTEKMIFLCHTRLAVEYRNHGNWELKNAKHM